MKTIVVKSRQSVLDVAIQAHGSVESVIEFAILNGLSLTDELEAGTVVTVGTEINGKVKRFYDHNDIVPATAISKAEKNETISQEGIEFWGIENDFIVS